MLHVSKNLKGENGTKVLELMSFSYYLLEQK
jgi:hypothetical protein